MILYLLPPFETLRFTPFLRVREVCRHQAIDSQALRVKPGA